jgi:hypothetical protein
LLLCRDEKQQLLLGIRRAKRQPTNLSSSVLSSDSMHIGILAAAAHASANNSPFTVFYNPRSISVTDFILIVLIHNIFDCQFCMPFEFVSSVLKFISLHPSFMCRASPSEFVIPLAKYYRAVYSHQISPGMRFRMMFETEDSGTRRCFTLWPCIIRVVLWKMLCWKLVMKRTRVVEYYNRRDVNSLACKLVIDWNNTSFSI